MMYRYILPAILSVLMLAPTAQAQNNLDDIKESFLWRYNYGANRLVRLAEALPEETFSFRPSEGAMSMEHVFMHIIRFNYYYPESVLGIRSPEGIDVDNLEELTGKEAVLKHLQVAMDYVPMVLDEMSEEDLRRRINLYNQNTQAINLFLQLQAHMAEHLGQLLAYTRMNDIVPPWSR